MMSKMFAAVQKLNYASQFLFNNANIGKVETAAEGPVLSEG